MKAATKGHKTNLLLGQFVEALGTPLILLQQSSVGLMVDSKRYDTGKLSVGSHTHVRNIFMEEYPSGTNRAACGSILDFNNEPCSWWLLCLLPCVRYAPYCTPYTEAV